MAVFPLLTSIAGLIKVRVNWDRAVIDNPVFRLHYRTTAAIFFVCCLIVSSYGLIGDPIQCINSVGTAVPQDTFNIYCWISSTFSIPGDFDHDIGSHVAYPGVGTGVGRKEIVRHAYYQWVPFMLFFQGILFYIPHWLWKTWEENRVRAISEGLRGPCMAPAERKDKQKLLVGYITETMHMHNGYAWGYIFCELLNLVNVVGNIFFIDKFLHGVFLSYGTEVVQFAQMDEVNRTDPMIKIFPRITKCTFHMFGASGTVQKFDSMCVLALNILNEKIYIFLWFWLIILACLSVVTLLYRFLQIFSPLTRAYALQRHTRIKYLVGLDALIRRLQIGDFFLISLLGKNLNTLVFQEVLDDVARKLHLESTLTGRNPPPNDEKPTHSFEP